MPPKNRFVIATFLLTSATFLGACSEGTLETEASTPSRPAEEATLQELVSQASADSAKAAAATATATGSEPVDEGVMDESLDGSSTEAFEKGLAHVRASAPSGQAQRLDSALQYLLAYDLSVRHDKAKLYAKLDGKTPNEIITAAKRR